MAIEESVAPVCLFVTTYSDVGPVNLEIGSFSYDFRDDGSAAIQGLVASVCLFATIYSDSTPV